MARTLGMIEGGKVAHYMITMYFPRCGGWNAGYRPVTAFCGRCGPDVTLIREEGDG